jgi:heme oxygenase
MPAPAKQSAQEEMRALLRRETRANHDRVDAAFGRFDLKARQDYAAFLTAHRDALSALDRVEPPFGLPRIVLRPALEADLASLSAASCVNGTPPGEADDAFRLGGYYVVAGSQAGARLLRRQWARSADAVVLSAGRYLEAASDGHAWAAFRTLDPPADLDRARLVAGARTAFDVFHRAALIQFQRLYSGGQPSMTPQPTTAATGGTP